MIPDSLRITLGRIESIRSAMPESSRGHFASMLDAATAEAPASIAVDTPEEAVTPSASLPQSAHRWQGAVHRAADAAGIDPQLLNAVVWTESDFVPDAVSSAGAVGLAQLMPATAEMLGVDPYDPEQNLVGGATFLSDMIDRYDGRIDLALAAYNAGPTRVTSLHDGGAGVPISENYVDKVLDRYQQLGGNS